MTAIRIDTTLESDTLHLPELQPLVGKSVEIIVREKAIPIVTPGTTEWSSVEAAVRGLENYDFEAVSQARDEERRRASEAAS